MVVSEFVVAQGRRIELVDVNQHDDTCDHNGNILATTATTMASTKDSQRTNDEVESLLHAALNYETKKPCTSSVESGVSCSMLTQGVPQLTIAHFACS